MKNAKRPIAMLILSCLLVISSAYADVSIIPKPNKITEQNERLILSAKIKITGSLAGNPAIRGCVRRIIQGISADTKGSQLKINIDQDKETEKEGYQLSILEDGIDIKAGSPAGAFYGLQTLKQLILFSKDGSIPCVSIKDSPRYAWRGFMLDESRHFFGKEKVKELLDYMAMYKLNRFHWHLTDSPGWRLEITKYPKLTSIGARGNHSNRKARAMFYTQDDIKEIVQYASDRFIEIIPEIDMPGHAAAAVRAYPEVGGGGSKKHPNFTFNPGSEKTYSFLTDVLTEVAALFPSKWIHYGGDEVHFANKQWLNVPEVKDLMAKENLKTLTDIEHYFNRRMAKVIAGLDRTTAAWDEVVSAGLDKDQTLVFWWRHNELNVLQKAFDKGLQVVLCPQIPCYFDFVQEKSHRFGRRRRRNGFSSLDRVYKFPSGLKLAENQVEGIQANLWTERVQTEKRLDFMTFPRLLALSEAAWTEKQNKDYEQFLDRLKLHIPYMESNNTYYYNPFAKNKNPEPRR